MKEITNHKYNIIKYEHFVLHRHNLAYVYAPSKISKRIHATAIHLVIISVALLQFLMVVFTLIRSGGIELGIFSLHTKVILPAL